MREHIHALRPRTFRLPGTFREHSGNIPVNIQ
jgi:hypothetical protein